MADSSLLRLRVFPLKASNVAKISLSLSLSLSICFCLWAELVFISVYMGVFGIINIKCFYLVSTRVEGFAQIMTPFLLSSPFNTSLCIFIYTLEGNGAAALGLSSHLNWKIILPFQC